MYEYVLRQHTSVTDDTELTHLKLMTRGIVYHIHSSWRVIYEYAIKVLVHLMSWKS